MKDKQRIIDLQKQVAIARKALTHIARGGGTGPFPYQAEQALDELMRLDPAPSLAGLLGHERTRP